MPEVKTIQPEAAGFIDEGPKESKDWYAWNNLMPPKPDDFHVTGWVLVANPGIEPVLTRREPQGFNPSIIMLDLTLEQRPGVWPMVMTWKQVRYDEVPSIMNYSQADIHLNGQSIALIKVENVH